MEKYLALITIPAAVLLISLAIIYGNISSTGSFMERDVELTGGLSLTIATTDEVDIAEVENALPGAYVRLAEGYGQNLIIIQTKDTDQIRVMESLHKTVYFSDEDVEIGRIEPAMGEIFWSQAQIAMAMAFFFMAVVVLILFRSLVPSFILIFCAIIDITMTVAAISLLGVKLSLPVFAGLLMLIGYSVDTDILLTTRTLRGSGKTSEKIRSSIKTGMTMTLTSIAAVFCLFLFSQGTVIREIAIVLLVGLGFDMMNTWITNAGILRFWLERKESRAHNG